MRGMRPSMSVDANGGDRANGIMGQCRAYAGSNAGSIPSGKDNELVACGPEEAPSGSLLPAQSASDPVRRNQWRTIAHLRGFSSERNTGSPIAAYLRHTV